MELSTINKGKSVRHADGKKKIDLFGEGQDDIIMHPLPLSLVHPLTGKSRSAATSPRHLGAPSAPGGLSHVVCARREQRKSADASQNARIFSGSKMTAEKTLAQRRSGSAAGCVYPLRHAKKPEEETIVTSEDEKRRFSEVAFVGMPTRDIEHFELSCNRPKQARLEASERAHLQSLDSAATAGPPWWLRRWSELRLFLNATLARTDGGCNTVVGAAMNQLDTDLMAARALEQTVVDDGDEGRSGSRRGSLTASCSKRSAEINEEGECVDLQQTFGNGMVDVPANKSDCSDGALLAQIPPVWFFVDNAKRMTYRLVQDLLSRVNGWFDRIKRDTKKTEMRVLGIPDSGGQDGKQSSSLCPAVLRLHASIVKKSIIMDVFASPMHLCKNRAQLISDGFRLQTPLIHADYVTEENVQPVYDVATLLPPQMMVNLPITEFKNSLLQSCTFVFYIDYIRFRPFATNHSLRHGNDFFLGLKSGPLFPHASLGGCFGRFGNLSKLQSGGQSNKVLLSFTREDQLVSDILDNYERYRMIELNLLPHPKSRRFYQNELKNLDRQPHLTEEQMELRELFFNLLNLTSELLLTYLRAMLSAWKELARLRGEDQNKCFSSLPYVGSGAFLRKESVISSMHGVTAHANLMEAWPRRGFLGLSEGAVSLLSDYQGPQASSEESEDLRLYLRPTNTNGNEAGLPCVHETSLLDYTPVIEGLGFGATNDSAPSSFVSSDRDVTVEFSCGDPNVVSQAFKVLLFVRTSATTPPVLVGSSAVCKLNSSMIVFVKESFEVCTGQEPQEIILHIVSVGGPMGNCVVATVSVLPCFVQEHLLIPLKSPISFSYNGESYCRHGGDCFSGVLSLSATRTVTEGMTIDEVETLFLRGDADLMDPKYNLLLKILRDHYMSLIKSKTTPFLEEGVNLPAHEGAMAEIESRAATGEADGVDRECRVAVGQLNLAKKKFFGSRRLKLLHRRWLFHVGSLAPKNVLEARLFLESIPLWDKECRKLERRIKEGFMTERRQRTLDTHFSDSLFHYVTGKGMISTLLLSPFSRKVRLQLWQERLQSLKSISVSFNKLRDCDLLERLVILPKLHAVKSISLAPQRYLNPRREERPKKEEINRVALASRQDSRIVVHIMKATALPQRQDGTPLEPFVEVTFAYETQVSRSEAGTAPSWFETLNIPFSPPDFDDRTLSLIEDDIVISVYDKLEIPMASALPTAEAVVCETHYRTERRLLGTLRVPFSTLYHAEQARTEGQFPLSTPRWVLGYSSHGVNIDTSVTSRHSLFGDLSSFCPSIQLYISLWPPLNRSARRELDHLSIHRLLPRLGFSEQLQYLHEIVLEWRQEALKKVKNLSFTNPVVQNRKIEPFVFSTTGDLTLVCRYLSLTGGPPPLTVKTVGDAIHFVALMLFRVDTVTRGSDDVWSTSAEMLRVGEGDYAEFSILLAYFLRFLAPNEVTFLVTGKSCLYEKVVMVLHSFGGELRLIDPHRGWVCPLHDPYFAFFSDVYMVISHDQVWANIQLSGTPHKMDWNLHDRRFWLPCFDHENSNIKACLPCIASLQRETLTFAMPNHQKALEIEQQLRKAVRRALVEWRNNLRLTFHHGVVPILQTLLQEAEEECCRSAGMRSDALTARASQLLNEYFGDDVLGSPQLYRGAADGDYSDDDDEYHASCLYRSCLRRPGLHIMGSPVNAAYRPSDVDYQDILLRVFETAAHEVGTTAASFAIGVYVKGYTNEVYSMWVFLVALYEVSVSVMGQAAYKK